MLEGAEASAGAGAAGTCAAAFRIRPEAKVVAIANESFIRLEYSFKIPASRFLDPCSRAYAQTNPCLLRNLSVFIRGTLPRHEQGLKRRGWRHQQEQGGLYGKTEASGPASIRCQRFRQCIRQQKQSAKEFIWHSRSVQDRPTPVLRSESQTSARFDQCWGCAGACCAEGLVAGLGVAAAGCAAGAGTPDFTL